MLSILVFLLPVRVAAGEANYTNVLDAIAALTRSSGQSQWEAVEYLAKHPEQSVPPLMQMVEKQENGWIFASGALTRSMDARVVPFYIGLLRNNFYAKEADGTRKQYGLGSKNGCTVWQFIYGGVLARSLGEMGDKRAIPVLKQAAKQGDTEVRKNAYEALYKLRALSLDELFKMAKDKSDPEVNIPDIIEGIGWANIHSDPRFAIMLFDRVIAALPSYEYEVASAHFWKAQCFELLKQYDDAIRECNEVTKFPRYNNLTSQVKEQQIRLKKLLDETSRKRKEQHSRLRSPEAVVSPRHSQARILSSMMPFYAKIDSSPRGSLNGSMTRWPDPTRVP